MITAIIFDCFGVLVSGHWQELWAALPNSEQTRAARNLDEAYSAGIVSREEFLSGIGEVLGKPDKKVEELLFGQEYRKNTQLLDYICTNLKPQYKIAVLSNIADNWIREELLNKEEQALFDQMILSFEVGLSKPDPQIFELACKRLDVETSEAVMIDDVERYCTAARDAGLQAIRYENFVQMHGDLEKLLGNY